MPPFSLLGMLYVALLGVGGALLGRAFSAKHSGSIIDNLLWVEDNPTIVHVCKTDNIDFDNDSISDS